jgi:hypothetical protein
MPSWCLSVNEFYAFVRDGAWDLDLASEISAAVFSDKNMDGIAQNTDNTVGLAINSVTSWITSAASQITLFYQDENDGLKPKVMQDTVDYQKVADRYVEMLESRGVCMAPTGSTNSVLECTKYFLDGNVLFAYSRLGELEADRCICMFCNCKNTATDKSVKISFELLTFMGIIAIIKSATVREKNRRASVPIFFIALPDIFKPICAFER